MISRLCRSILGCSRLIRWKRPLLFCSPLRLFRWSLDLLFWQMIGLLQSAPVSPLTDPSYCLLTTPALMRYHWLSLPRATLGDAQKFPFFMMAQIPCNIIDEKCSDGTSIVRASNWSKVFLACCIPDLQFEYLLINFYGFGCEFYSDGDIVFWVHFLFDELLNDARLAHA